MAPISKNGKQAEGKDSSSTSSRRKKRVPQKQRQLKELKQEEAFASVQPQPASTSASTNYDYLRRHNPLLSRLNLLPSYFQDRSHIPKGSAKRLQEVIAAFEVESEDNPYCDSGELLLDERGIEKWARIKSQAEKGFGVYKAKIEEQVRDVEPSKTFAVSEDEPRVPLKPLSDASFAEYDTSRDENDKGDSVAAEMDDTQIVDVDSAIEEDKMGTDENDEDGVKENEGPTLELQTYSFTSLLLPPDLPAHLNAVRPLQPPPTSLQPPRDEESDSDIEILN